MSNPSEAGAKVVGHLHAAPQNGGVNIYEVAAGDGTALFLGDFVDLTGDADATTGVPLVQASTSSSTKILGVIVGFVPYFSDLSLLYRKASTQRLVYVADDPNIIIRIQEDSTNATWAHANTGSNAKISTATAGNTTNGTSGMQIDANTITTSADQLRHLRLSPEQNNAFGANAKHLILINQHVFKQTAGV